MKIHESDYKDNNFNIHLRDHVLDVELTYPGLIQSGHKDKGITHVEVNLSDVRAADGIRISYDYDRDGWKIEQQKYVQHADVPVALETNDWFEVAFVQAWALEE